MKLNSTFLASVRTFEASIRTNSIFVGLSYLIMSKNKYASILILGSSMLLNLFLIILFIRENYHNKIHDMKLRRLYIMIPLIYSIILLIIQFILFYIMYLNLYKPLK